MDLIKKIFKGDKVIWVIFFILCVVSIIEVFSAASTLTYKSGDHWSPIIQHSIFLFIGFMVMLVIMNIEYQWFKLIGIFLTPLAMLLLAWVTIRGFIFPELRTNGAARWTELFGIQFQPSELAKLGLICFIALILSKYQKEENTDNKAFKYIGIVAGIICLLIAIENFSTAAILGLVTFILLFIGRVKIVTLLKSIGIILLLVFSLVGAAKLIPQVNSISIFHRAETWVNRVVDYMDETNEKLPPAQYMRDNAQRGHANIAIATSGLVGLGPGNSVQRDFLSQAFSDFIYAIIIEELGLIPAAIITFFYICILVRIGKIARTCNNRFGTFLVLGIGLILVTQAMVNMMVAVELLPITGQPLPLISKGGSSMVINCAMLGMVLSVSYYSQKQAENKTEVQLALTANGAGEIQAEVLAQGPHSELLKEDDGFPEERTNL